MATSTGQPPQVGAAGPISCAQQARLHFAEADSASVRGGVVLVQAHPAALVCGGPDDLHYDTAPGAEVLHLSSATRVTVVTTGGDAIASRSIPAAALPAWLPHDEVGRTFQVDGPPSAVTALLEQYHP